MGRTRPSHPSDRLARDVAAGQSAERTRRRAARELLQLGRNSKNVTPVTEVAGSTSAGEDTGQLRLPGNFSEHAVAPAHLTPAYPTPTYLTPGYLAPGYLTTNPASTGRVTPVTKRASSETSQAIALLMSMASTIGTSIRLSNALAKVGRLASTVPT